MFRRGIAGSLAVIIVSGCSGTSRRSTYIPPLPPEYTMPLPAKTVPVEKTEIREGPIKRGEGDPYLFDGPIDLNGPSGEKKNPGLHVRFYREGRGYALEIEDPYGGKRTHLDIDGDLDPETLEFELGPDRKRVDIRGLQSEKDTWNLWLGRIKAERGL